MIRKCYSKLRSKQRYVLLLTHSKHTVTQLSLCSTLSRYGRYQGGMNNMIYPEREQTILSLHLQNPCDLWPMNRWQLSCGFLLIDFGSLTYCMCDLNQASRKCTESANSSTDLDQSKQTTGVKMPLKWIKQLWCESDLSFNQWHSFKIILASRQKQDSDLDD